MSEKKGFWKSLFGGGSSGGCCNMQITEEPQKKGCCCDMQIIEEDEQDKGDSDEEAPIQVLGAGCKTV